jgi:hypothetical protein
MAINTFSKNSISIIVSLLLVIILSESKLFFFFTESYLGRSILIIIILFASYLNKILGIVCVFIIIIMFNSNMLSSFEGFDNNTNASSNEKIQNIKNEIATKINENELTSTSMPGAGGSGTYQPNTTTTSTTKSMPGAGGSGTYQPNTTTTSTTTSMPGAGGSGTYQPSKINVTTKTKNNAVEGFDLQATENNIKRGKQSNSIQVNPYLKTSLDVAPYEGHIHANSFNEGFSLF